MSQSEWIAAALIAGFILYLAVKGKLNAYWWLLAGGGTGAKPSGAAKGAAAGDRYNAHAMASLDSERG